MLGHNFWGTIITVPLTALVTILVVLYQAKSGNKKLQKQLKADKENAIASEIYLEKYKAINKSINQIVDIRKELFDLQDNIFKLKENYYLKDTILNLRHIKHKFILMNDLFKYMEISEELGKYYNYILKYIDRIIDLLSIRDGERFNESAKESVKKFFDHDNLSDSAASNLSKEKSHNIALPKQYEDKFNDILNILDKLLSDNHEDYIQKLIKHINYIKEENK